MHVAPQGDEHRDDDVEGRIANDIDVPQNRDMFAEPNRVCTIIHSHSHPRRANPGLSGQ